MTACNVVAIAPLNVASRVLNTTGGILGIVLKSAADSVAIAVALLADFCIIENTNENPKSDGAKALCQEGGRDWLRQPGASASGETAS